MFVGAVFEIEEIFFLDAGQVYSITSSFLFDIGSVAGEVVEALVTYCKSSGFASIACFFA